MKYISVIFLAVAVLLAGCRPDGKPADNQPSPADSVSAETPAPAADTLSAEPPATADGLFDDFIYNFMRNARFQKERVRFPLYCSENGRGRTVEAGKWTFDALYANSSLYAVTYAGENARGSEKREDLSRVVVEKISLKKDFVKQYVFEKERGKWMLMKLDSHALARSDDEDFWHFFRDFAGNPAFQRAHIKNPFGFKTYDSDTYQEIDGVLDVEQWSDFRPELPADELVSINYDQRYADSPVRIVVLTSSSAGLSSTLVFERHRKSWRLTRLEDI